MCNALILSMLSMLVFHTEMNDNVLFWICWGLAILANTTFWKNFEDKVQKGE